MASFPDEFDDGSDDEQHAPLLPREDRIWRHPSELATEGSLSLDPVAVRSRWLSSAPSRASAWTAGFVGALLATGLVVVGTHLAGVLSASPGASSALPASTSATSVSLPATQPNFGSALTNAVDGIGHSLAVVDAASANGTSKARSLGIVISKDGAILTAASAISGAASILVYLPGSQVASVGHLVGVDARSGLAVLRVQGASDLQVTNFSTASIAANDFALAVTTSSSHNAAPNVELGAVVKLNVAVDGSAGTMVDSDLTNLSASTSPLGSPLLNSSGQVDALVTGSDASNAVVVPAWLAVPIANQLLALGTVRHGWLGISADSVPSGVQVMSVDQKSAAAAIGLRQGDVIVYLDNQRVTSLNQLQGRLYVLAPGAKVSLVFTRDGRRHTATITLASSS